MNRRLFLKLGTLPVATVGGCLFDGGQTKGMKPREFRSASVIRNPHEYNVTLSVELLKTTHASDHTGRIKIKLTNNGESSPRIGFDTQYPGPMYSVNEDFERRQGLILVPENYDPPRKDGCWEPTDGYEFGGPGLGEIVTISPGETFARRYSIWSDPNTSDCMKPGTYRFGSEIEQEEGRPPFSWLFSIRVSTGSDGDKSS